MTTFTVNGKLYHGYAFAQENNQIFYVRIKRTGEVFRVPVENIKSPMSSVMKDLKK